MVSQSWGRTTIYNVAIKVCPHFPNARYTDINFSIYSESGSAYYINMANRVKLSVNSFEKLGSNECLLDGVMFKEQILNHLMNLFIHWNQKKFNVLHQTFNQAIDWECNYKVHSQKRWSKKGASEEPFWKMAPLWQRGAIFSS